MWKGRIRNMNLLWINRMIQTILLGQLCLQDMRGKKIAVFTTVLFGISSMISGLLMMKNETITWFEITIGAGIGLFLVGLAILSKEKIGIGDGIIVTLLGFSKGIHTLTILCIASFLSSIYGIYLLVLKKQNRNTTFAFMPAITLGYIISLFWVQR